MKYGLDCFVIKMDPLNDYMTPAADVIALKAIKGAEEKTDLEQHSICNVFINNGYVYIIAGLLSLQFQPNHSSGWVGFLCSSCYTVYRLVFSNTHL